jgi:hypothetical protein
LSACHCTATAASKLDISSEKSWTYTVVIANIGSRLELGKWKFTDAMLEVNDTVSVLMLNSGIFIKDKLAEDAKTGYLLSSQPVAHD